MRKRGSRHSARVLTLVALTILALPLTAGAGHGDDPRSRNLHPLGDAPRPAVFAAGNANTDLAFWGKLAFQGSYDGFRIVNIAAPGNPKEVVQVHCNGNQGDVSVWENLLFRSVDRPQTTDRCDSVNTAPGVPGFEGIQIFDISDPENPQLIKTVPVDCGSHTQTLVPDLRFNRVLLYVSSSGPAFFGPSPFGNNCQPVHRKFIIVEVPLFDPTSASVIGQGTRVGSNSCHDIAVFTAINRAVCAGSPLANVFDISDPGTPVFLYNFTFPGVTSWHSASFTWDGKVIIMGWEPGGGAQPRCQATTPDVQKSLFFFDTATGDLLGTFVFPQAQSAAENCTVHNYNVVPLRGRYVLVSSQYQGGTNVVDFTDPANAFQVAFSDPPPLVPTQLGGAWSSYWYDGFIYESDITEGLNVFNLSDRATAGARKLGHLNPQTQEEVIR